jgi:hypothetical protein
MRGCGYRPSSAGARLAQWWPESGARGGEDSRSGGEEGARPAMMLCSCSAMAVTRSRDREERPREWENEGREGARARSSPSPRSARLRRGGAQVRREGATRCEGAESVGHCCCAESTTWCAVNTTSNVQLKLHFYSPPSPNPVGICENFSNISCRATCQVQLCLYEFGPDHHGFHVTNSPTCLHGK